jgi:membrane protein DedA with SNARE-associated domain
MQRTGLMIAGIAGLCGYSYQRQRPIPFSLQAAPLGLLTAVSAVKVLDNPPTRLPVAIGGAIIASGLSYGIGWYSGRILAVVSEDT